MRKILKKIFKILGYNISKIKKDRYPIENGSTIYTSGSGDLFQTGIPIGAIKDSSSPKTKEVTFFSDFSQLNFVKIISYKKMSFNLSKKTSEIKKEN